MRTQRDLTALILILFVLALTACDPSGGGGGGSSSAVAAPGTSDPAQSPSNPSTPVDTTVSLSYYSKTTQLGVPGGYTSFTGNCIQYVGTTYCWDDGEKEIQSLVYCSFWQVSGDVGQSCTASNKIDSVIEPTTVSTNMYNEMMLHNLMAITPAQVLSTGTAHAVTCTDTGASLECGSFTVDLTQAAL